MIEQFSRSWGLIKASATVLRSDKELLVFPLVSSIAAIAVAASFLLPAFGLGMMQGWLGEGGIDVAGFVFLFAFYLVQYFVIFFFNSALVGAAMIRLDGGDPTVVDGLRIAWSRKGAILGYAAIAATVGMVLRAIEQRVGFLGQIIVGLIGVVWTVATFLAVPVLVARDVGPIDAVKESAALLKRTWGENIIGNGGIGLVFGLFSGLLFLAGAGTAATLFFAKLTVLAVAVAIVTVFSMVLLALVQAALAGIYSAALYRYATQGDAPAGFDGLMLRDAFQRKA